MYLIGDRPVDNDEVFAKINEKLKAEINATIDVKFMSWGEYEQKYLLIFASGEDWDIIYTADWCFTTRRLAKQGFLGDHARSAGDLCAHDGRQACIPKRGTGEGGRQGVHVAYELQGDYLLCISGARRPDGQIRYQIRCVPGRGGGLHGRHRGHEPTLIPLDVGSTTDKLFVFDRMWQKANWESEEKVTGVGSWQAMASVSELDDGAAVKGNFDQPEFQGVIERLKDWKDRGFWSKNAVVNTQNNTESFQAGKSALALCNVNTAKSIYAQMTAEHPEWDVRVFDAQEDVPRS